MRMTGEPIHVATAEEWRKWLEANAATEEDVWLMISKKHAETLSVTLQEAMQEAICFGWIDSQMQPIDEERYALRFTPRRKTSNWSERNKGWAARLIEDGRMTEAGLAKIEKPSGTGDGTRPPDPEPAHVENEMGWARSDRPLVPISASVCPRRPRDPNHRASQDRCGQRSQDMRPRSETWTCPAGPELAARAAHAAPPGDVLAARAIVDAADGGSYRFEPFEDAHLKGSRSRSHCSG